MIRAMQKPEVPDTITLIDAFTGQRRLDTEQFGLADQTRFFRGKDQEANEIDMQGTAYITMSYD